MLYKKVPIGLKMVQKGTSSWGQSISPDLLVPKPPDTTEMSKGEHFQIWKCRMEENWLQVFIKIHILMIFSFTWRNTGSLDIEHGLKIQNCGQTLHSYILLPVNCISDQNKNKISICPPTLSLFVVNFSRSLFFGENF